jgi:hypothetical protein
MNPISNKTPIPVAFKLKEIVPWGRSLEEYAQFFNLSQEDRRKRILGCGDGPASFNTEMSKLGHQVVSVDPLYQFEVTDIAARFEDCFDDVIGQVSATPDRWNWDYHRNPEQLGQNRRRVMEAFLADFPSGLQSGRYRCAALPELPFDANEFDLVLCSHLLFLYSEHLSEDFHVRSVLELGRVAREIRIFPLLTLAQQRSPHLEAVTRSMRNNGWSVNFVSVRGGFQIGAGEMLHLHR